MRDRNINVSSSSSGGIGFVSLLTIVFIVLKLLGKINWSWWWVLSPLWIDFCLVMLIYLGYGIYLARQKKKMTNRWSKFKNDMMSGNIKGKRSD